MEWKTSFRSGYRLSVPKHRSVQLSNLESWLVLGVWARLAEMVGSDWVGLILFVTVVGSGDWLALSWALFSMAYLILLFMSMIFVSFSLPFSSML